MFIRNEHADCLLTILSTGNVWHNITTLAQHSFLSKNDEIIAYFVQKMQIFILTNEYVQIHHFQLTILRTRNL